jgi:hypothetical protein
MVLCEAPPGEFRNEVYFALTFTVKEINEKNVSRSDPLWKLNEFLVLCKAPTSESRNEVHFAFTVTVKEINEKNVSHPDPFWQL